MRILVLASTYPQNDGVVKPMYIHMRNKYYQSSGIDVTVLNFQASSDYIYDNIPVLSQKSFLNIQNKKKFDVLVSHAPNIRNHYRFLKTYSKLFPKIYFVFHGHEVLRINKLYPAPFTWKAKSSIIEKIKQDVYDTFKLKIWKKYLPELLTKAHLIFVSQWMYDEFIKNTKIDPEIVKGHYSIIYNSVGEKFECSDYDVNVEKKYDLITIRKSLDGEKYSIDIVNNLALTNPSLSFLVVGVGEIFNHIEKASNLTWINKNLNHDEMLSVLNSAKCALMPTRTDAQGLLMCEMATYGIPVITSNINVCKEVFGEFDNVELISNDEPQIDLSPIVRKLTAGHPYKKNLKYSAGNTSGKEVELILGDLNNA